jgi:hypothetical protein
VEVPWLAYLVPAFCGLQSPGIRDTIEGKGTAMPLATSPTTEALANELAALRGLTPDEVVAEALRAELAREQSLHPSAAVKKEPTVEEWLEKIRSLGPWNGPSGKEMTDELYDDNGLPR